MSQVDVNNTHRGPLAGNTSDNLLGKDRDEAVQAEPEPFLTDIDEVGRETEMAEAVAASGYDPENTFDVSRAEFVELQDAYIELAGRINKYNIGAPHKI